ncbi:LacI family DNA-binding transcriptional regulator [Sphaerisporangium corydalis]|uniref:LacI family DNA-binding transcriptional regulator n=1 Tax=Sphaerisporangium corydalis TaxID=1441875 RepID=A0ABV9EGF3_9ACTN|nr:LacI family DNA-binding transcriptional regulator [Sphaerisporangium corydalis]
MARNIHRSPVMADVARLAGVSHQTVSRVLNDHPNVRPETRDRVIAAIEGLGYRRNSTARALVTKQTNTLGVVAFDTTLYGPASTLYGIERAARDAGYFVSIVSLRELTRDDLAEALDHLGRQQVDGLVVIAPQSAVAVALSQMPQPVPVVTVEGDADVGLPVVNVDQRRGGVLVTEHLLRLGHRTVWHVSGPQDWLEAEGRIEGWRETLLAAGAPVPEVLTGDWSPRSGYRCGQRLAGMADLTAVFVANDQMALGVLRALDEARVRVPDDVSVVGFDDIPESEFFAPPLTTVSQDFSEVGRKAIELLLDALAEEHEPARPPGEPPGGPAEDTPPPPHVVVQPHLVVRRSSGPPRAA